MVTRKPRIVIIGAGMAGLTAANKLYTSATLFELAVVEGGNRIGGRVNTSSFCGDRVELGATWIHGVDGSPVYRIADETGSLRSDHQPWECMDTVTDSPVTVAEGGHVLSPSIVEPVSALFKRLMDFVQGKADAVADGEVLLKRCGENGNLSVGAFLRQGLEAHWASAAGKDENGVVAGDLGNWTAKSLRRAIFAMHESVQRTFTSADDLCGLDYNAEREYVMFPGDEITIAGGYSSVVESLASALPAGTIQLGRRVDRIEWRPDDGESNGGCDIDNRPVKLHFSDGSVMSADHVIVTVSLGVLKRGVGRESGLFSPPLPGFKARAIARLGYGVVNKVFLQLARPEDKPDNDNLFPFLQMVFHQPGSEFRSPKIPNWIRKTSFLCPIYSSSRVLLSWFTGQEALELESLTDDEIIDGFETTVSNLIPTKTKSIPHKSICNGTSEINPELKFEKVLRTQWGTNPLFLGSYSYVAVGSSIDDMDTLAEPLPKQIEGRDESAWPLQILFAGEATHRTHYSTTHGAYFSGLREANRLLKHYNYNGV